MGTVYITHEDAFVGKTDERLTVKADKQKILDVPLIKVDGAVILGRATISPALVSELLDRKIPLTFMTRTGRYRGCLTPELTKNIFVRRAQWEAQGSLKAVAVVRGFISGKLKNYRNLLLRRRRERENLDLESALTGLENAIAALNRVNEINVLRGHEGAGSAAYFGCFVQLIAGSSFEFVTRRRRPPTDPVNALLSLGYALLRHHVQSAVNLVGFDPYLGFLHVQHYGKPALALDLMEEFRPLIVDAVVLNAVNNQLLSLQDFESEPVSGAVSLTATGLKVFLKLIEQKLQSKFKHPVLQHQCSYRECIEIQARLLSKYLLGEIDRYPPLVLK